MSDDETSGELVPRREPIEIIVEALAKVGVLVVTGGLAGPALALYDGVRAVRAQRLIRTIDDVFAQVDPDLMLAKVAESEQFAELVADVLDTAARTAFEAKRRLLARVLVNAAHDHAQVDDAILMASALHDLDAPHIRALARIRAAHDGHELSAVQLRQLEAAALERRETFEKDYRIEAAFEISKRELAPIIAALIRTGTMTTGVIADETVGAGYITTFGRELLNDLRSLADEDDPVLRDAASD